LLIFHSWLVPCMLESTNCTSPSRHALVDIAVLSLLTTGSAA
jgi:hypothetical protein